MDECAFQLSYWGHGECVQEEGWEGREILTSPRGAAQGLGCGAGQRRQMRKPEQSPAIEWTWSQVREGSRVTLGSGCRE